MSESRAATTRPLEPTGTYWFLLAVFLNALVVLGHVLSAQAAVLAPFSGGTRLALAALLTAASLLPFVVLVVPCGTWPALRGSLTVLKRAALATLLLCVALALCHWLELGLAAFFLSLLLAAQAAVFAAARFALARELLGSERLTEINADMLALWGLALLAAALLTWARSGPADAQAAAASSSWVTWGSDTGLLLASILSWLTLSRVTRLTHPDKVGAPAAGTARQQGAAAQAELPLADSMPDPRLTPRHPWFSRAAIDAQLAPLRQDPALRTAALGLALLQGLSLSVLLVLPGEFSLALGWQHLTALVAVLACSGLGVALGALQAGRSSRDFLDTGGLPLAALGLALGLWLLPWFHSALASFLLLTGIGYCAAWFVVPLRALIQFRAGAGSLSQTLAASHWLQAVISLATLGLLLLLALLGSSGRTLLWLGGAVALAMGIYTVRGLPHSLCRLLLVGVARFRYRLRVQGLRHIPARGGVLLLGNHVSLLDWAFVQIACPRSVRFGLPESLYTTRVLRWFFRHCGYLPLQSGVPTAAQLETIAASLDRGEVVCLFPEGVMSRNGQLTEFRSTYEQACASVSDTVVIVPFFLRGLAGSQFSRSGPRFRRRTGNTLNREVVIDFGAPLPRLTPTHTLRQRVRDLAYTSWEEYAGSLSPIGAHWIDTCCRPGNHVVLLDTLRTRLRAKQAPTGTLVMARRFRRLSPEQNVGLLLPSSAASALANMALMLLGKTAVNLNFTAPVESILASLLQAEIKTIYTSERFLERLEKRGVDLSLLRNHARLIPLEQFRQSTSAAEKLLTLAACWLLPRSVLKVLYSRRHDLQQTAVILFSSGSEGLPKGVMLTHRNLLTNVKQIAELLNMDDDDVMLANLPPFHAFGLTVTHFMPMLEQVPLVCHADPTDALGAAEAIAEHRITTMFGTCSFYRLYTRNARIHPLMLASLRLVIAGAEKLQEEVRREFKAKFDKDILEGYGATETAPVASVNMPDQLSPEDWKVQVASKVGSVGMPLPGTSFLIVDPETFEVLPTGEAGMILISGAQVMPGYLKNERKSSEALRVMEGRRWYVTGDKGRLDADGFLFIIDRYSRFAKVGGEMVGLGTVETAIKAALAVPDLEGVVVALPDERKGEKLVALATLPLEAANMRERLASQGLNALAFPSQYLQVDVIPKLGSGKTDFATARQLALTRLAAAG